VGKKNGRCKKNTTGGFNLSAYFGGLKRGVKFTKKSRGGGCKERQEGTKKEEKRPAKNG